MPAKKAAKKATKKAAKKAPVKKTATKAPAKKAAAKKAASKSAKPKASDLMKRESHTPAIFKTGNRRPAQLAFTIEDVRQILKKRARDEEKAAVSSKAKKTPKKAVAPATKEATPTPVEPEVRKSRHEAASLDDILGIAAAPTSPGKPVARSGSVPKKFEKYYNLLLDLRKEVRDELNMHSSDTLKRSQKEDSGDNATSVDAGTDNFDRDFALSLLSSEQEALKEIEEAIQRIHNGTYGICEVTGEPIAAERLEAVPFTRFSLEGQRQYESSGARKRVQRTGAFLNEGSGENITFGDDDADS